MAKTLLAKLEDKILIDDGCWEWTGGRNENGYGVLEHEQRMRKAHRVVYELLVGPIPAGLTLDHLCRNPSCVRPSHLEPVTQQENVRRGMGWAGVNAQKTHCMRGHEFTPANTYEPSNQPGGRRCIACANARKRAYYRRDRG